MPANCWEFMRCGHGPREAHGDGTCPVPAFVEGTGVNGGRGGGRVCWAVSGTLCGGEIQGSFAQKEQQCTACEFYRAVQAEQGRDFSLLLPGQTVQEVLHESDERFRRMFDGVPVGLYRASPEGFLIDANPPLVRMLGCADRAALRNVRLDDLCEDPGDRARRAEALARDRAIQGVEMRLRRPDGRPLWVRESARAEVDAAGRLLYIEGALEDVTERRQVESQLHQAQKMEIAGHVVGGVVHDFNNLLTAFMSAAHLLNPLAEREPGMKPVLEELGHLAKRGSRLTHQLLAFVRKHDVQPRTLDLNAAVTDVQKMLRRLIGEDVELELALGAASPFVKADPGHVEQVLMNLAVNARDAMPDGGRLTIRTADETVRAGAGAPPGEYVTLSVTDTGCGMEPHVLARIFEPFFTTKPVGKGTGLGLPTVRTIVLQNAGQLDVESAPGRGSTFRIRLPRVGIPAEEDREDAGGGEPSRGSETVLLVEDEDLVRQTLRENLQRLGYTVLDARNGLEALEAYRRRSAPVDIVIADVIMPRMTGPELAARLAQLGSTARVLFVSGYPDDAVTQAGLRQPGVSFLQKPFTPDALAARVRQVLQAVEAAAGRA